MTILLDENFAGSDPFVIGFPSISTCLGLIAETKQALYGIHVFGDREDKARGAARAIAQMLGVSGETIIHLYGAANRSKRTPADWKAEMAWVADELELKGTWLIKCLPGCLRAVVGRAGGTRQGVRGWFPLCAGSAGRQGRVPGWRTYAGAAGHLVQCLRPAIAGEIKGDVAN